MKNLRGVLYRTHHSREDAEFTISVPGKCLLTGGYLILDSDNCGYSIALSCITQGSVKLSNKQCSSSSGKCHVAISSPDIHEEYHLQISEEGWKYESEQCPHNVFVEAALDEIVCHSCPQYESMSLKIISDSDFYIKDTSQNKRIKTGLGTSSAVVVILATSLLCLNGVIDCSDEAHIRNQIAHLSYRIHNRAQGKIGSGFDVYTAVYGSSIFESNCFCQPQQLLHISETNTLPFPAMLSVVMGCCKGGSSTPVLSKRVIEWRQSNPNSSLWKEYKENNDSIVECFQSLSYPSNGENAHQIEAEMISTLRSLYARKLIILRELSIRTQTNILSESLSLMFHDTCTLDGVVGACVAGAGGDDAFYCIYSGGDRVRKLVEDCWMRRGDMKIFVLSCHESNGKLSIL